MDSAKPLNEDVAAEVMNSISDPVVRNLLRMAIAAARMELIRWDGQTKEDWERHLPAAPFDMGFFARVVTRAFSRPDIIDQVLKGASVGEASGWDE